MLRTATFAFSSVLDTSITPAWSVSPVKLALRVVDCLQTPSKCDNTAWVTNMEKNTGMSAFHLWEYRSEVREITERLVRAAIGADQKTYPFDSLVPSGAYNLKYYD